MISLTQEQKNAIECGGNVALSACPGSGKTRVILAKLLTLADEIVETPRFIGCITYTNAAVDEIELRLKSLGNHNLVERSEVATIHSFCLQFILRPYRWLIPDVPKGFKILAPQAADFERLVGLVEDEFNRRIENRTLDEYASIRMDVLGNPVGTGLQNGGVTEASARRFWQLMQNEGYVDFSMILFYSFKILQEHPFVAKGISSRFKHLLIDEYQDTTDVQVEILRMLASIDETSFFLVGDPNQSIQGFAGARVDLADRFSDEIGARKDLSLSGNFRSSSFIVDLAERIIVRTPAMTATGANRDYVHTPTYIHSNSAVEAVTTHFLPLLTEHNIPTGNVAILAPWWQHLIPIARSLRELGIPVVGPGARPYKRSRLFSSMAEQLGACAESDHLLGLPSVERTIFRLMSEVTGGTRFDVFSYTGRRTSLALVYEARRIANSTVSGIEWLRIAAVGCSRILIVDGWMPESLTALMSQSVEEMLMDMERNKVDINSLKISDLGLFANPDKAIKLSTLHHAKGREFDAVALVNMNEGEIPNFNAKTQFEIDEAQRLFYVGATRAKKVLFLASDQSNPRNAPSHFLSQCGLTS